MTLVFLIIGITLLFWGGFFYRHSLYHAAQRRYTIEKAGQILPFIPLGLQGIFLFCYGLAHLLPLSIGIVNWVTGAVNWGAPLFYDDFYPLLLVCTGMLLISSQYALFQFIRKKYFIRASYSGLFLFILGFYFLENLIPQIRTNISGNHPGTEPDGIYHILVILLLSISIGTSLIPSFGSGTVVQQIFKKYLRLSYRWLMLYFLCLFVLILPQLLHWILKQYVS